MSRRTRDVSATSEDTQQTRTRHRQESATNTVDRTSMSDSTSVRSTSPATSLRSSGTYGNPSDAISVATTAQTGFTDATAVTANTSVSQQQQFSGGNTGVYNQPTGDSNTSSSGGTSIQQQQQPHFDAAKAIFTQADANRDGSISREEFRQWAQGGDQAGGQFQQQQQQSAQFTNQNFGQQSFNTSFGGNTTHEATFFIDYSVIEAYNVGFQSASDITAEQLSGGVDNAGKKFDVVKALFNQADIDHDGGITRDEFRQWADGGQQTSSGQSHSSFQTTTNSGNNFNHAQLFAGASPEVANILQQSGLGQGLTNYS